MASDQPVLLAYDASEGAKAAIDTAVALFAARPLLVLCVGKSVAAAASASAIGIPAEVAGEALTRLDEEVKTRTESLAEEGAKAAADAGLQATALGVISDGSIWATILRVAEENDVAAVLVGSRGRSDLKSILLGSVSNGVVHHSARPTVVVHGASAAADGPA